MDIVAQKKKNNKRYLPHTVSTKEGAVKLYRKTKDIDFVLRRYHISKASLMRWNKLYDGTKESLVPKSHRPHRQHPNAHTEEELNWIRNYHRRNPNISICELYGKLRQEKAYSRHPGSLYRVFVRLGYRKKVESTKKKSKHLGHYDTPTELGKKWQMDVKYVPTACYVGTDGEKFYQYTMIEEASREYIRVGDYYIPDLTLSEEIRPIGKWGRMHREYLKEHKPIQYNCLLLSGELWTYLADLNLQAQDRLERMIDQLKKAEGVTEELKAADPMAWVGAMNNIRARAEEIIREELIFI